MYLQSKLMESLNQSSYQNPYSALLGSSTSATAANSLTPSLSSASGLDANSAALLALFGAQLPSATTSQSVKSSTASALNQSLSSSAASSSLMNEAALTAEILANPSLALLLNNGALTNNNASSLSSSMAQFPFNMDFNTALQLNALTGAGNLSSLTQASPSLNNTSIASLLSGVQAASATSTPATSKKPAQSSSTSANLSSRASKLNAVVEKLASSSNSNNTSS